MEWIIHIVWSFKYVEFYYSMDYTYMCDEDSVFAFLAFVCSADFRIRDSMNSSSALAGVLSKIVTVNSTQRSHKLFQERNMITKSTICLYAR